MQNQMTAPPPRLLTEREAAEYLSVSVRSLQAQRVRGGGPRFVKLGRCVRYRPEDLSAHIASGLRASTSETTVREGGR